MSSVSVKLLTTDVAAGQLWDAYVEANPQGSFFHLSAWQNVLRNVFGHQGHYLFAEYDGEIVGVLPLAEIRSLLFGHALISTPFCVYGGILADDQKAFDSLEKAACELADDLAVDYLELRDRQPVETDWPVKSGLYVTFEKTISADHDANMKDIPRKQRAVVRKGIKAGLQSEVGRDTADLYRVYSESVRNLGTPVFSQRYLPALLEGFADRSDVLTVSDPQGKPLASVLNFYFRGTVLPYYGGGVAAARNMKAADFMYWQLMCHAADRGCNRFDYGRSKVGTGPFGFKKNWGFEPEPLHYRYYLVKAKAMPNLSPTNPKYRLFIKGWQRLPLALANLVGPSLAKNLG